MPMRVIAKKRCRAMFEIPEKGERVTLNPSPSTKRNLLFSDHLNAHRMSSLIIEMAGRRFGRLLVLSPAGCWYEGRARRAAWLCRCDCGATITTTGARMREGTKVSCGCWQRQRERRQYLDQPRDHGGKWTSKRS
jgi:hypothetical protein